MNKLHGVSSTPLAPVTVPVWNSSKLGKMSGKEKADDDWKIFMTNLIRDSNSQTERNIQESENRLASAVTKQISDSEDRVTIHMLMSRSVSRM